MFAQAPVAAQAMTQAVQSFDDYQTWVNVLSLPAVGWIGGEPPIPALDTNCPESIGVWINEGTALAVPLIPCRLSGDMAGDLVNGFIQHINMATEPGLLSQGLGDLYNELSYASVSFRKVILDPQFQTVVMNTGFFVKDAYAALPLANNLAKLLLKAGKRGIKNFKNVLKGHSNLRVDRFVLFAAIMYLVDRIGDDACLDDSCVKIEADKADIELYAKLTKIMGNIILQGKFTDPRIAKDGELQCKLSGDTHGAVYELLMMAYYHATFEYGGIAENRILAVEQVLDFHLARGIGNKPAKHLGKPIKRRIDIVLAGAGTQELDRILVELKSIQSKTIRSNRTAHVKSRFKKWTVSPTGTTYHRQFLLDRLAIDNVLMSPTGDEPVEQHLAENFRWLFQDWDHKNSVDKASLDTGISVARGRCAVANEPCMDHIRERLTDRPGSKQADTVDYNWPDLNNPTAKQAYANKIQGFNVGVEFARQFGNQFDFTSLPEEFQQAEKVADDVLVQINSLEAQAEELERMVTQNISDNFGDIPGSDYLKDAYDNIAGRIEKAKQKAEEAVAKAIGEIPEISLICED